ncbi:hypothetical protein MOQ_003813 [Trypanosoma cruzi marinkellei]|uniref:RING-type domain-containing protein n=1 Tax=Trypanosoma cruzi marinkellei TaxID=85056 RepID=K2N322_TRYCR|nr:hypothetical protein MOQ_003813 [Trypanosoma cruzi marinkellei]
MPIQRINFGDLNDGIDWVNALPPHIVAQQERNQALRAREQPTSLFMTWPLPEDSFPVPSSVRVRRESEARGTGAQGSRGRRGVTNSQVVTVRPQRGRAQLSQTYSRHDQQLVPGTSRQVSEQRVAQPRSQELRRQAPSMGEVHSSFARLASSMMDSHIAGMLSMVDEMMEMHREPFQAALDAAALFEEENIPIISTDGPRGHIEGPNYTRIEVSMQTSSNAAPQVTARVERGVLRPGQYSHRNRSGAEYDIITGRRRTSLGIDAVANPTVGIRRGNDGDWEINDFSFENLLRLDEGKKSTGLPSQQIRGMKGVPYGSLQSKKENAKRSGNAPGENRDECAICLDEFSSGTLVLQIGCGHIFHHGCLVKWFKEVIGVPSADLRFHVKGKD